MLTTGRLRGRFRVGVFGMTAAATMLYLSGSAGAADECGEPPPTADVTYQAEIHGTARLLYGVLGRSQFRGAAEHSTKDIFSKYPNADRARTNAAVLYYFCKLVFNDTTMSTQEKLKALSELKTLLDGSASSSQSDAARQRLVSTSEQLRRDESPSEQDWREVRSAMASLASSSIAIGPVYLPSAKLQRLQANGADLSRANLSVARLDGASLESANFENAQLEMAVFDRARLRGANFENAFLAGAGFNNADLESANLSEANLLAASMKNSSLITANLRGADLTAADLRAVDFTGANLEGAVIRRCNLRGAKLSYFRGQIDAKDLVTCCIDSTTRLPASFPRTAVPARACSTPWVE